MANKKPCCKKPIAKDIKKFGDEMVGQLKSLKDKYHHLDDKTKKGIVIGLASVAAVIAGVGVAKKAIGKKR